MAMAYATPQHGRAVLVLAAVALVLASPMATTRAAAAGGCEGDKLAAGKSYAHCAALPYLGAKLHWTYDAKTGSLSLAFAAKPTATGGWVSWAVNPTGDGMKGAQALLAFKAASGSTYVVNTYNMTGYKPLPAASTAIAYKPTDLAADENAGEVRIYGKLQLGAGLEKVNHIWQVGAAVTNGVPAKHAFDKANLLAKGQLVLSGAVLPAEAAPAPAPAGVGASPAAKGGGAPAGGKSAAAPGNVYVSAPALALLALAGFLGNVAVLNHVLWMESGRVRSSWWW